MARLSAALGRLLSSMVKSWECDGDGKQTQERKRVGDGAVHPSSLRHDAESAEGRKRIQGNLDW